MLNDNSQRTLSQILLRIIEGENKIEILRKCLCENYDFAPRVLFRSLCRVYSDSLLPKDFKEFLLQNGEEVSDQETYLLVRQYSSLQNGRMSEEDFSHFVLSATNETLPMLVSQRYHVNEVKLAVKYSFLSLLKEEIRLHRETEALKVQLFQNPEFSLWKAFEFLNSGNKGFISEADVESFLRKRGKFISVNDFDSLMRRIDLEDDLVISYNEFLEAFIPLQVPKGDSGYLNRSSGSNRSQPSESNLKKEENLPSFRKNEEKKVEKESLDGKKRKNEEKSEDRPLKTEELDSQPPRIEKGEELIRSEKDENLENEASRDRAEEISEEEESKQRVPDEFRDDESAQSENLDDRQGGDKEISPEQENDEDFGEQEFSKDNQSDERRSEGEGNDQRVDSYEPGSDDNEEEN